MLARLQQCIVFGLLTTAAVWSWAFWPDHPWTATIGALAILMGFALILAFEFALLSRAHGVDPAPRATAPQLLRAWWGEACTTPRVFFWHQPFRAAAEPDCLTASSDAPGLVLVHGLFCNRGFWNPWMRTLRAQRRAFIAVNLSPPWGSLDAHM
ncbi:MAG: permease, partial [Rhodoferax sp.]|nr:permease [Rhodoferax sp.]